MLPRQSRWQFLAVLLTSSLFAVAACSGDARELHPGIPSKSAETESAPAPGPVEDSGEKSPGIRVGPTYFGMHDGRVASGVLADAPIGSLRLWDSGTMWLQLETSPGQFAWETLDAAVETAESSGVRPLLVLGQTPNFHASSPQQEAFYGSGAASMPDLAAWRRYVTAVAERYGDRIEYQIWNEANVKGFWSGTPRQMARLTTIAAAVIRDVVPGATVVAPAFALRLPGQRNYFEEYWSQQTQGFDLASVVDAVSVQLYPQADELPEAQPGLLDGAREVLDEYGVDKPVWNTEINYGLTDAPPISEERQRAFLMRTYILNAGMGVSRVYWYRWDLGPIANTFLTEKDDYTTETLAGRSFDVVRDWLVGTRAQACTRSDDNAGVWTCTATTKHQKRTFWWKPRGPATKISVEDARAWVNADGKTSRCHGSCQVPVGETPVMVVARR